jgi:hypothetical protein
MAVRGVARGGPIMCLAYVVVMMFLPMVQLDCGLMQFDWTGVELVTGSAGPLEGMGERMGDMMGGAFDELGEALGEAGEDVADGAAGAVSDAGPSLPKDWAVLALPVLALLGIFALLARSGGAAALLIVLLLGAFAFFTVRGFEIERMFAAQLEADLGEAADAPAPEDLFGGLGDFEVGVKKATPFWLGFGASGLALVLLLAGGGSTRRRRGGG